MKIRSITAVAVCLMLLVGGTAYVEHRLHVAAADVRVGMIDPRTLDLKASPIRPDWILDGDPRATSAAIGSTHDESTSLMVWRVSAGRFNWIYAFDETVTILDGEVFLTDGLDAAPGNPKERRLGPGDVAFFHIGSRATWRVPDHVRKIATIKLASPAPVASLGRWLKRIKNLVAPPIAASVL